MRLIILSIAVGSLLFQYCSEASGRKPLKQGAEQTAKAERLPTFPVSPVQLLQPDYTVTLPGELNPYEQVNIYPKVKGFVKKIYADRGSVVRKGQLLALLEAPEIGEEYSARKSSSTTAYQKLLFSRQTYNRLKEASLKNGAVASIELEKAYAQYLGDSAAYNSSRSEASASGQMQGYLRITAPFSGTITGRFISEGALVSENGMDGKPLFTLTQQEKLRLTVSVPEKQVHSLSPGAVVNFTVLDLPGKTFKATLSRSSHALDNVSRSLIAEFDIENSKAELRAGQYAKVKITMKRPQPTLFVPRSSIINSQSGIFVILDDGGQTKRINVQPGITVDSLVEVFGNLEEGQVVLKKGNEEIKDGTRFQRKEMSNKSASRPNDSIISQRSELSAKTKPH